MHGISSIDIGCVNSTDKVMDNRNVRAVERVQLRENGKRWPTEGTTLARHRKQ
jgi:hypothetical protein